MIKILTKTIRLSSLILFNVARARRNPNIPTQANFLRPFSINYLNDNEGAKRYPKIVGRGPGSGKGKFAARGMKGHKARSGGGVHVRFEGGQTPISRKLPKFGRIKRKTAKQVLDTVNLEQIHYFVQKGILNSKQPITIKHLSDCGLAKKVRFGVKILGKGIQRINYPLHLEVTDASKNVINQIQSNGGSVKLIFRTKLKLRQHLYPQKFPLPLKEPLPPAWRVRQLSRLGKDREKQIIYRKPLWKIEEQKVQQAERASGSKKQKFVYPIPNPPNPTKIHVRKTKLYRRVSYHLT